MQMHIAVTQSMRRTTYVAFHQIFLSLSQSLGLVKMEHMTYAYMYEFHGMI